MGSGDIAPRINFGARWKWVLSFTRRPLYSWGKEPSVPIVSEAGCPQSWSGRGGEEKGSLPQPGIELRSSTIQENSGMKGIGEVIPILNKVPRHEYVSYT
jgi:hypothetical protein